MEQNQHITKPKFLIKASGPQRKVAIIIFIAGLLISLALILAAWDFIDLGRYLYPCGFQMRHKLPCPTCGVTASTLLFFRGHFIRSFYIQPAGAVICILFVITVFLSFITAVFGVYFGFLKSLWKRLKVGYIVLAAILVLLAGWAVTLARALAVRAS